MGLCRVLVAPSPKVQVQAVGPPVLVSVKARDWPTTGLPGGAAKAATGALAVTAGGAALPEDWQARMTRVPASSAGSSSGWRSRAAFIARGS